jgi:AP2 domain
MMTVHLGGKKAAGRVTLVDDADFELVSQYRWTVWTTKRGGGPYAITNLSRAEGARGGAKMMHALLTGWPMTDHADGDGLNNQRYNLRRATVRQNQWNRRPDSNARSPYKGVSWESRRNKWRVRITAYGREHWVGLFVSEIEAAKAYDVAARELFGAFAWLNFPDS